MWAIIRAKHRFSCPQLRGNLPHTILPTKGKIPEFEFEIKHKKNPTLFRAFRAIPSWACLSHVAGSILCFGTSIYVVKFITHTFMCIIDLHAWQKNIYMYIYRSSGGPRIDSDGREKWMCAAMRSVDEQRLSHYGDIKHTSGTHIILWAIKMLGKGAWQRSMLRNNRKTEEERGR